MPSRQTEVVASGKDSPPEAGKLLEGLRSPFGTMVVGQVEARTAPAFQFYLPARHHPFHLLEIQRLYRPTQ
jgi:hypothetical protein